MATVYNSVNGKKITKVIALTQEAQTAIEDKARFGAMAAEGYLNAAQHRTGTSQVSVEHGNVDWYAILDDTRGLDAALTIEYGRAPTIDPETGKPVGGMDGLFVLHKAFPVIGPAARAKRPKRGGDNLNE